VIIGVVLVLSGCIGGAVFLWIKKKKKTPESRLSQVLAQIGTSGSTRHGISRRPRLSLVQSLDDADADFEAGSNPTN